MDIRDYLSDDGQAVLALCSAVGLGKKTRPEELEPLKLSEWSELERQIEKSSLGSPCAMRGLRADELARELTMPAREAERIARLLERAGALALEMEAIFSSGIWAVTRVDEQYPGRLRETLKHQAPTVLFGAGDLHLLNR